MSPTGPVTEATPVGHRAALPAEADIVVIGGGVAGVCTALFAAEAGRRVVLLEKGRIAGEQSSRNWGWIRQQGRDAAELPMVIEANRTWRALARRTNEEIGLRQCGTAYLMRTERDEARYAAWLPNAREHGLDTRLLSREELRAMMPDAAPGWRGALWTPSDLCAEPWVAVPALARLAAREGALLREACAVRRLDIAAGRVAGVVTEEGRIAAPRVVLAGGAWSSLFLRAHGVSIPQLSVRASVAATEPMETAFEGCAADDRFAFRKRADGGYTLAPSAAHDVFVGPDSFRNLRAFLPQLKDEIGQGSFRPFAPKGYPDAWATARRWRDDEETPFERMRVLDPAPNRRRVAQFAHRFEEAFPKAGPVRIRKAWAGMIDTMPDMVPILDRVDPLPGLVLLTGLSGHGFGIGPGAGRVAADLAMDRDPGMDLRRFRFARFTDGSRVEPGPHL